MSMDPNQPLWCWIQKTLGNTAHPSYYYVNFLSKKVRDNSIAVSLAGASLSGMNPARSL